ncbi:AT7L1 protein, partial [Atractosteus spatula]|nr:AT7L1 protein [Atractosteus spatula]
MAVRERAAAVMAALERRFPSLDDFAGQSWSSWVERAALPASEALSGFHQKEASVQSKLRHRLRESGRVSVSLWAGGVARNCASGGEVEECGKSGRKRQEAMTLRKEAEREVAEPQALRGSESERCLRGAWCRERGAGAVQLLEKTEPSALNRYPAQSASRSRGSGIPAFQTFGTRCAVTRPLSAWRARVKQDGGALCVGVAMSWGVVLFMELSGCVSGALLVFSYMSIFGHCPAHDDFYLVVCGHCSQVVKPQAFEKHCGSSEKQSSVSLPDSSSVKPPPPPESPQASPSPSPRDTPPKGTPPLEKQLARRGEPNRTPETLGALSSGQKNYKKASKCDLDKHCGVMDPERKKLCTRLLTCNIHSIHQRRKVPGRTKSFDLLVAELKNGARTRERGAPVRERPSGAVPSPETPGPQLGAPHGRGRLANCTAPRSWASSESGAEEDGSGLEPQGAEPMSPPQHSRLSSEESEGEGPEEPSDWSYSPWHPKPLGVCSFGSHALGRGIFTFDRRLHRLRAALSSMVERHLNSHLWKKIPQAADLQSPRTSAPHPASSSPTFSPRNSSAPASSASLPSASPLRTSSSCLTSSAFARETRPQPCPAASPSPGTACGPPDSVGGGGQSITSPLPANTPSPSGPSRAPTPAGKASKPSRQKERPSPEHVTSSRKRKRQRPPLSNEDPPSHERNCVAQGRGRTPVSVSSEDPARTAPSHHGPINGSLSPGKPRPPPEPPSSPSQTRRGTPPPRQAPPPDPSSRGRGASPSMHSKAVSYDHKGLGKKRKSGTPPSPAEPRAHKPHRTPHSPHASLFPWKKDGRGGGGLAAGLERKLGAQKVGVPEPAGKIPLKLTLIRGQTPTRSD